MHHARYQFNKHLTNSGVNVQLWPLPSYLHALIESNFAKIRVNRWQKNILVENFWSDTFISERISGKQSKSHRAFELKKTEKNRFRNVRLVEILGKQPIYSPVSYRVGFSPSLSWQRKQKRAGGKICKTWAMSCKGSSGPLGSMGFGLKSSAHRGDWFIISNNITSPKRELGEKRRTEKSNQELNQNHFGSCASLWRMALH